jgi:hypothetical protein
LKSIIKAKPSNGAAFFTLGNVYLTQSIEDSAKIYFQNGLNASEGAKLNHIGLGQMDLDKVMLQEHKQSLLWLPKTLKERRSRVCVYC